ALPGTLPSGARTFLRERVPAAARPTPLRSIPTAVGTTSSPSSVALRRLRLHEPIDRVARRAGQLGRERGRPARRQLAPEHSEHAPDLVLGSRVARRGAFDDDHELAEHRDRVAERRSQRRQGPADHLLVHFRELARDRRATVRTERANERVEGLADTVNRLEQHERARLARELGEPIGARTRTARQESLEYEPVGRETRDDERGRDRARTGDDAHVDARLERPLDEPPAWIADERHPGIADERERFAGDELCEQRLRAALLVMLVQRD